MAGSTNFLTWNPAQNNQETDSQYTADSLRLSGAPNESIFTSELANKLFHQTSILPAALTQALAAKGYICSDADQNALAAVFANLVTLADLRAQTIVVAHAPSMTFDASLSTGFETTLTGNVDSSQLLHVKPGDIIVLQIAQDSVGGRTFQFPSNIANPSSIESAPNTVNLQAFRADSSLILRAFTPLMTNP